MTYIFLFWLFLFCITAFALYVATRGGKGIVKRRIPFLERPVTDFISEQSKNEEVYLIDSDTPLTEVLDRLLDPRNTEKAVVVVKQDVPGSEANSS